MPQVFLAKVANHPVLRDSKELQHFLEAGDQDWALEMARWQAESSSARPPAVNGALQWFKSLQASAQGMVSGRWVHFLEGNVSFSILLQASACVIMNGT